MRNQEMKTTDAVPLKFCSELNKVRPGRHTFLVLTSDH